VGRFAAVGCGAYIALTSLAGIFFGVQAGDGWLAIIHGSLGITMGAAGIVGAFVARPLRSALLGWFLVGIATRAVVGIDLFFLLVGVPVAAALLAAFAAELLIRRSTANTLWGFAGGASSIVAFALLVLAAPHLPVICQPPPPPGTSVVLFAYPGTSVWPWDGVGQMYFLRCGVQH